MYIVDRSMRLFRGFLLSYGPQPVKRRIWEREYSGPKWHFRDNTSGDCLYAYLEEHAKNGSILDLGCGLGNTAAEIRDSAYQSYVGVDISEVALEKARSRSRECGREGKNDFVRADFLDFQPSQKFDVILFRESMYFIPVQKMKEILLRYAQFLKEEGVFIAGLYVASKETAQAKERPMSMLRIMETEFDVVQKRQVEHPARPTVIVFRPRKAVMMEKTG